MKLLKNSVVIASLLLLSVSCVEQTAKYKSAIAQRDSIAVEKQVLDSNFQQTLALLNEIEMGFYQINENEKALKVNIKGIEGNLKNKREAIVAQVMEMKERIQQNKSKLQILTRLASKNENTKIILNQTIKRLQTEMEQKQVQIQALQLDANVSKLRIAELSTTVVNQNNNIAEQKNFVEQQKELIIHQDANINTVWFYVATFNQLKDTKIISNTGIFQTKKLMDGEFDKKVFTQVDLRKLNRIPIASHKLKIMSSHPKSSYTLITGINKNMIIEINNPAQFWSISKYLVVQI